jgi:hypothetical protein
MDSLKHALLAVFEHWEVSKISNPNLLSDFIP